MPLVSNRRVCQDSNDVDVSQRKILQIATAIMAHDNFENPFGVKGETVLLYHAVPSFAFT